MRITFIHILGIVVIGGAVLLIAYGAATRGLDGTSKPAQTSATEQPSGSLVDAYAAVGDYHRAKSSGASDYVLCVSAQAAADAFRAAGKVDDAARWDERARQHCVR